MAASTGSPASRRSANLTPLTTRPSFTSRQGMTRTLNLETSLSGGSRISDQPQRRRRSEPPIVEPTARDGAGQLFRTRRQQRLYVLDRGIAARRNDRERDA